MAPRGGNEKKESGRAKKAENEKEKKKAEADSKEKKEAEKWAQGSKGKGAKEDKEEKRLAELKKKEELKALLAAEEAGMKKEVKAAPKAGGGASKTKKPAPKPAGPGAIAAGGGVAGALAKSTSTTTESPGKDASSATTSERRGDETPVESFSARGVDAALELMEVVNAKTDKASRGQAAAGLEKHPERRFKAAFASYEERELPKLKEEHPGLRRNQYSELLYKNFKKSPDNPFNQATVAFDATKEERLDALREKESEVEERLRERLRIEDGDD